MRLTLRARLAAIVSLLCLLLIIAAVWGIIGLRAADQRAQNAYQNELLPLQYSSRLYRMVQEQSATLFDALRYWTDSSEVEKRLARIAQYGQQINADRHTWQQLAFDAQTKPLSQRFLTHLDGWQGALHEAGELLKGGNPSAALVVIETRLRSGSQLLQQDIDQLDALMRQHAQTAWQQGNRDYLLARNSLIAILLLGLSLALVSGWLLIRSINRSIARRASWRMPLPAASSITVSVR
ncbi:MCP four helix bundle domain-containing protein [Pantoea dispersa]|uniref:MCP four helix bundle domain-containing protein n=1 Tax=Pantoea dispersa TaxID=59814 RepID=UPI0021AF149B|nr:MCP four helix bundle domain-containing protein [Pantoea dispersa]MCT6588509.1 MCP four helix bundle domain-containing protein [Pantoea dispersa]